MDLSPRMVKNFVAETSMSTDPFLTPQLHNGVHVSVSRSVEGMVFRCFFLCLASCSVWDCLQSSEMRKHVLSVMCSQRKIQKGSLHTSPLELIQETVYQFSGRRQILYQTRAGQTSWQCKIKVRTCKCTLSSSPQRRIRLAVPLIAETLHRLSSLAKICGEDKVGEWVR